MNDQPSTKTIVYNPVPRADELVVVSSYVNITCNAHWVMEYAENATQFNCTDQDIWAADVPPCVESKPVFML